MAIAKTATRDLTTAIAGKIWEAIKDADNNSLDNQSSIDPEVRKAKRDLDKSDPDATSVEDKPLRESLSNMFGKIDTKLIQIDSNVNTLSGKVSAVGGAIADTQKLIINQNEMLLEKFDQLSKALGINIDAEKKAREDLMYEQLSLNLAQGDDLSTTSGYAKARRKGGSNILLSLLGRRLGRMFGRAGMKFIGKLWKKGIFKRPRVLSKLLRRHVSRKLVKPTVRALSDTAVSRTTRKVGKNLLIRAMRSPIIREALIRKLGKEGVEKLTTKLAGKAFPGVQTAYGALEGITRGLLGDWKGMMLSFGSAIPYAGYAFTGVDLLRDIDIEAYTKHIEPNFPPSEKNIADFFQDALNISPNQYETGTPIRPQNLGIGGIMSSIAPIVSVVRSFGEQSGEGQVEAVISQAGLGNVPTVDVSHSFTVGRGISGAASIDPASIVGRAPEIMSPRKKEKPVEGEKTDPTGQQVEQQGITLEGVVDGVRDMTGGVEGDGVFSLPFGWEIPNPLHRGETSESSSNNGGTPTTTMLSRSTPNVSIDESGESGVDFTPHGSNNRVLFPGTVTEIGHQYNPHKKGGDHRMGSGYGNYVVVTSIDPSTGQEFDGLYAHFPKDSIVVREGDYVEYGDILGPMATASDYANPETRIEVGSGNGPHTSFDALEKGTSRPYSNWRNLMKYVDPSFSSKKSVSELTPGSSTAISSLNSVESPIPNIVSEGSMNRHVNNKQARKRSSIVIINNQIIKTSNLTVPVGSQSESGDFFPAYNLARLG